MTAGRSTISALHCKHNRGKMLQGRKKGLGSVKDMYTRFLGERRAQKQIEELQEGLFRCQHCGATLDLNEYTPLALLKCPNCEDLIFVPMAVNQWWATEPLAAGGFGSVYLGRLKTNPKDKVIIKVLRKTERTSENDKSAFEREYEVASKFGPHPNLASVLDYGIKDDIQYLVMEFIDGERMSEYIALTRKRLPEEECVYYLLDIVDALDFIYSKGYLHRDVKPENVIIGTDGFARLVDYGSCITEEEAKSPPLALIGSPHFLSPERYRKMGEDLRSDIYALGMLAYFGIMGKHYASAETLKHIVATHMRSVRVPLAGKMAGIDPEIVDMIDKMTKPLRDDRLQSYDEVRQYIYCILAKFQKQPAKDTIVKERRKHFLATYGEIILEE